MFKLNVLQKGLVSYFYHSSVQASDFYLRVEIVGLTVSGSQANSAGILIRNNNNTGGYIFGVNTVGQFEFKRKTPSGLIPIINFTPSSAINLGGTNVLEIKAIGPKFELSINGVKVATPIDSNFSSGGIGFYASTYGGASSLEANFDNLLIRQP